MSKNGNETAPISDTRFKNETGMTISTYVQKEKIKEAKRLLKGSKYTVAQISDALLFPLIAISAPSSKNNRYDA